MPFTLNYWRSKGGTFERVYINGDFIDGLKIYFMKPSNEEETPRVFGCDDRRGFPEPYASSANPLQAVALVALESHDIDSDDFTWDELMEATL